MGEEEMREKERGGMGGERRGLREDRGVCLCV